MTSCVRRAGVLSRRRDAVGIREFDASSRGLVTVVFRKATKKGFQDSSSCPSHARVCITFICLVVCATDARASDRERPRASDRERDRPAGKSGRPEPQIKGKRSAVRAGRTRCCSAELRSTAALQSRQLLQDGPSSSSSSAAAAGERGALGIVLSDAPSAAKVGERGHIKGELHLQALVVADAREVGVDVTEVVPRRLCGAGARCSTGGGQRGSTDTGGRGGDTGGTREEEEQKRTRV